MNLEINLHVAGLSLTDTVSVLDEFGGHLCQSTVHNWIQKADLQPTNGDHPHQVAIDVTVIQINSQRSWLYAAVDPHTKKYLDIQLFPTKNQVLTQLFFNEIREKHQVDNTSFLVDSTQWLHTALNLYNLRIRREPTGVGTPRNVSSKN